ncbi:GNAT family N-acetyltransferase [Moritella viscosa]|uniref:Ribosomal-protein-alanine acetyltransferase n=1 Tax=Moritella viscosa TaxID=80854 RepID=A0ABY1HIL8_9GAMM|nr:GNAT family N-acetyltransferase [Moritella viscosa]SGZ00664.1 Ribosomal-protein-alanine acetyltransferase [Moritella viscosa]SGZ16247.1 Ribosomal-protein-alanine acetyltransferase [Moritella viscosa]SHO28669.1 Ribosomal-protein-alanine acetyltransferase [Moritella viscosa]
MKLIPELETENLIISVLNPDDVELLVKYERDNRSHLSPWEPTRIAGYFGLEETKKRVELNFKNFQLGSSISLVAFDKSKSEIICLCTFSNIVHGVFQACNLGYSISEKKQGKGLMFEMLQASIQYVFIEYNLHRVMANYIPSNIRSEKLLDKLGFQKEGMAKSYLKISGSWQDHVLTSKINLS